MRPDAPLIRERRPFADPGIFGKPFRFLPAEGKFRPAERVNRLLRKPEEPAEGGGAGATIEPLLLHDPLPRPRPLVFVLHRHQKLLWVCVWAQF